MCAIVSHAAHEAAEHFLNEDLGSGSSALVWDYVCFGPLGEVIHGHEHVAVPMLQPGKWAQHVHPYALHGCTHPKGVCASVVWVLFVRYKCHICAQTILYPHDSLANKSAHITGLKFLSPQNVRPPYVHELNPALAAALAAVAPVAAKRPPVCLGAPDGGITSPL